MQKDIPDQKSATYILFGHGATQYEFDKYIPYLCKQ